MDPLDLPASILTVCSNSIRPAPVPADGLAAALAPFGAVPHAAAGGVRRPGGLRVGAAAHLLRLDLRRPRRRPRRGRRTDERSARAPTAVLLVRGDDGTVRAFANTCRHRGHELLACGATTKRPQHRLPVPLLVVPARRHAAQRAGLLGRRRASTPTEFGLAELRLVNWHGWLFVDPSGAGRRIRRARRGLGRRSSRRTGPRT